MRGARGALLFLGDERRIRTPRHNAALSLVPLLEQSEGFRRVETLPNHYFFDGAYHDAFEMEQGV